ncbi:Duplicated homeodomain-like superfamily protein [Raphanus sativus]|uniref:Transcription factor SRM1-like n=1 Tax=Raphanus sativus TaxID=3726 RepID=A0A6J0JI82_RAPSA|nr:transcription factor SRM1-like [Raphanus sativus]KAJ4885862.1 Duplicated homeodomain-like superfamily protein [Raphanus sativus]
MAANSWTKEENELFKNAVECFSAFSPNRFERIAHFVWRPVVEVIEHYQEMVDDLLEIRSSQIALSNGMFDAVLPSWCRVEKPKWDIDEHEWFLIGLRRYGRKWDKIAVLLGTKTPMQVAIYARKFFTWHNPGNNVMKRRRTMEITMGDTSVDSSSPQKRTSGDINMDSTGQQERTMGGINVDSTGQHESLVPLQPQPQQGPVALEIGQDASISDSESNNLP